MSQKPPYKELEKQIVELENELSFLRQSEEKYRSLFTNGIDAISIFDIETKEILDVNDSFLKLYGYTREEALRLTTGDVSAEPEKTREAINKSARHGETLVNRRRHKKKDGTEIVVDLSAGPFKWQGRNVMYAIIRDITERKNVESRLKESQGYLQALLDNTTSPIFLKDDEGRYILVNQQYERLAQTTGDAIKGKDDFEIFPEPVASLFRDQDNQVKEQNRPLEFEETIHLPDGEHTFITTKFPLRDDNNNIYAVGGLCVDITNRIRSEQSLRDNEQLLNSIFRSAPIGIGLVVNRIFHWTNERISELTGYSSLELKNQSSRMLYPSDEEFEWVGDRKYKLITENGTGSVETSWQRKDGEIIDVLLSSTPLDPDDLSKGVTFTVLDITLRKRFMQALEESEEKYREIYNDTSDAIFIHDAETGKIIDVNHAVTEIYGFTIDEAKNMPVEDFSSGVPPYTEEEANKKIACAAQSGPQVFEWHARKKTGELFWTEVALKFAEFSGKKCVIAVVRDISDRKQIAEELIKIKKLESIGVLAGGIAHDFNNILASILGNISLAGLYIETEGEKAKKLLQEAEKASLRAKDLTQQLLTFSKGGEPVKQVTSIAAVIKDSADFVLRGSNSKCEYSFAEQLWPVEIDTGQISQVIQNIIINASQAMPEGGIIDIYCECVVIEEKHRLPLSPGEYIKISIMDKGIGIPGNMLDKIFDPYFTTKQEGSGLGLAITHSIIVQHSGHISVESDQGVGSTFTIYIPASPKKVGQATVETDALQFKESKKILVLEDEEIVREIAQEVLIHLGCEVALVKDGEEAIETYQHEMNAGRPFDLVIMDLTIPGGMGGKDAIRKLLEIDPQAKAIVASGYSNDPVMSNYRKYGFKGVIAKPFLVNELNKIIHKVLDNK